MSQQIDGNWSTYIYILGRCTHTHTPQIHIYTDGYIDRCTCTCIHMTVTNGYTSVAQALIQRALVSVVTGWWGFSNLM